MAKRRKRMRQAERDPLSSIASPLFAPSVNLSSSRHLLSRSIRDAQLAVRSLEDRRAFHPLFHARPAASVVRDDARVVDRPAKVPGHLKNKLYAGTLGFNRPAGVSICSRREERREVLFAKGGLNGRSRKRRNYWSSVSCKG